MKRIFLILTVMTFASLSSLENNGIVIGTKNFTEQVLLGEIMAQLIETDIPELRVDRRFHLGGTHINFEALKAGQIDLYPEYTGTALLNILGEPKLEGSEAVEKLVKRQFYEKYRLVWMPSFGFHNSYALAVRSDDPNFHSATKVSDLRAVANQIKLGTIQEFISRDDGLVQLDKVYALRFLPSQIVGLDAGLMYLAIQERRVNMISAFATDGRIRAFDLRLLQDDLGAFPPYAAAPLVREATLKRIPALKGTLGKLAGRITEKKMREMNYQSDYLGRPTKEVAQNFLMQEGLIPFRDLQQEVTTKDSLPRYFWANRFYVLRLLKEHLFLTVVSLSIGIFVGVPLAVFLTSRESLSEFVFGVINTFQTIPSIALLGFMIPLFGIGVLPAVVALFLYSLLPLVRNTYTGIREIDPAILEASRGIGLTPFQILRKVQMPLALPMVIAGIRTSTVLIVSTATLASLIGAGGLGDPIFRGISSVNTPTILLGALPAALLAISLDKLLHLAERVLVSKGLQRKSLAHR